MEQRFSNDKRRHHYIPITYLNKFTDISGNIIAYRKDDPLPPLCVPPKAIAFENYYYSQPLPDGGQDNNTLEDFFASVEGEWTPLADRLRTGREATDSFTNSDFESLFTFLGLMRVRVPATRDMVEISLAESCKAEARLLDRLGKLPPKPEGMENILDDIVVSIDPHRSLHAMGHLAKGFGFLLDHIGLEVIHNRSDVSFLTSDNPVVCFDPTVPEASVLPYQVRPPLGSIELLFPIDAETVLRGRSDLRRPGPPKLGHVALTARQEVKRVNRFVARFGYRFVFARDRTHDALITKHAGMSPIMRATSVPGPREVLVWSECVFGPRPIKPKWEATADGFQGSGQKLIPEVGKASR
jgi:hypothetical protein